MRDLIPFVQFKKREKQPWRSVTFNEVENSSMGVFYGFVNGTKSRKASVFL